MNRNFKVPSKILKRLETERENQRLYLELNTIKPTMSFSLPRECSHLKFNKKREQIKEGNVNIDRYTEIERENRILLEKINLIIQNRQHKVLRPHMKNSLNLPVRARHQREISLQNLSLLKRLQSKKSFYSFRGQPDKHRKNKKSEELSPSYSRNSEIFGGKKKLSPINKGQVMVYSSPINLQDHIFSVEVFKSSNSIRVVAKNQETQEQFVLDLSKSEVKTIIGAEENWQILVNYLHLEGNDLILCGEDSSESI